MQGHDRFPPRLDEHQKDESPAFGICARLDAPPPRCESRTSHSIPEWSTHLPRTGGARLPVSPCRAAADLEGPRLLRTAVDCDQRLMESPAGGTNKDDSRGSTSGPCVCDQARSENTRKPAAIHLGSRALSVARPWCSVESGLRRVTEGTRA